MSASLPALNGSKIYCIGIQGTGVAALAELAASRGARVSGSDNGTYFTAKALSQAGIPFFDGFTASQVPQDADVVVYSSAYKPETNAEMARARELGLPMLDYPQALGAISAQQPSAGVAGVHGKTTTTAMAGTMARAAAMPGFALVGSTVRNFGNRPVWSGGGDFFVAETCEYQRHFLNFHPRWMILTSVESDHQDYFPTFADIQAAFVEYGLRLPKGGLLVYCADDPGAAQTAGLLAERRPDIHLLPYGFSARGPWRIHGLQVQGESGGKPGHSSFLLGDDEAVWRLGIPGVHSVRNAAAAAALVSAIQTDLYGPPTPAFFDSLRRGLAEFAGTSRRSEILGSRAGVLVVDDYAHHPAAIRTTLEGFRAFYPGRRIVADFMSHTYSRTSALLDDFAASFGAADVVLLHKIYASAREQAGAVSGRDLWERTRQQHTAVHYIDEVMDGLPWLREQLKPGDLFITLGAGDNWRLAQAWLEDAP